MVLSFLPLFTVSFFELSECEGNDSNSELQNELPLEFINQVPVPDRNTLPLNFCYRRRLSRNLLDVDHMSGCKTEDFHTWAGPECICTVFGNPRGAYHICNFDH